MAYKSDAPITQVLRNISDKVYAACLNLEYLSPGTFRSVLQVAISGYNQGRGNTHAKGDAEVMDQFITYSKRARCESAVWMREWIKKSGLNHDSLASQASRPRRHPLARLFGTAGTYPLEDFGVLFASHKTPGLVLFSWSGYVLPLEDLSDGIAFAALLWDALKQAEDDLKVVEPPQIPEDYATGALEALEDQLRIDAWKNTRD